jgi:hypothetical protein
MDRLYQRYADPFSFINGMIRSGRFHEFVRSFWNNTQKELNEEKSWEFYLHRVLEGSFDDFMKAQKTDADHRNMSGRTIETTVNESMNILKNFNPEKSG